MDQPKAAFEFTRDGNLYEIHKEGYVRVTASPYPRGAEIVINRIPRQIAEYQRLEFGPYLP